MHLVPSVPFLLFAVNIILCVFTSFKPAFVCFLCSFGFYFVCICFPHLWVILDFSTSFIIVSYFPIALISIFPAKMFWNCSILLFSVFYISFSSFSCFTVFYPSLTHHFHSSLFHHGCSFSCFPFGFLCLLCPSLHFLLFLPSLFNLFISITFFSQLFSTSFRIALWTFKYVQLFKLVIPHVFDTTKQFSLCNQDMPYMMNIREKSKTWYDGL